MDVRYRRVRPGSVELIEHYHSLRSYPPHSHGESYTLGLVLSGAIRLSGEGERVLKAGDSFVLPPLLRHSIHAIECYSMLVLSVKEPLPSSTVFADFVMQIMPTHAVSFISLYSHLPEKSTVDKALGEAVTALYHGGIYRQRGSKYHYIREFKKAAGLPPAKFRLQSMVRHAQRLLVTDKSLSDIAQECGFYDQSHFNRYFKYFIGLTPAEFKRVSTEQA